MSLNLQEKIRLTQYSHGAGCGCKIAPAVLQQILSKSGKSNSQFPNLIVGYESSDDAAAWILDDETAIVCTTDFFLPIVDDAFTFGKIAATNAISDIYAMGGQPAFALAILGFPVQKLPVEIASEILKGARSVADVGGFAIAGGHTIDNQEPLFGLAVNGFVKRNNIRKNNTARAGDYLFLTKSIGTGILTTALKRSLINEESLKPAIESMCKPNHAGRIFGALPYVSAMTDVTGFGLLGHLIEMCGESLSARLFYNKIQFIDGALALAKKSVAPDGTFRNWKSFEQKVSGVSDESLITLCDPQTSGGLLVAVDPAMQNEFAGLLIKNGFQDYAEPIGQITEKKETVVEITAN